MNRALTFTLALLAFAAGPALAQREGRWGAGHRGEGPGGPGYSRGLGHMAGPRGERGGRVIRNGSSRRDTPGVPIQRSGPAATQRPPIAPGGNHGPGRSIPWVQRREAAPFHYYWHGDRGARYWHYVGRDRIHWYGFYNGPLVYWTRFYGDRWWWFDVGLSRWLYWWNGYWWWPGPTTVYVYVNGAYQPYAPAVVPTQPPAVTATEPPGPAPSELPGPPPAPPAR